MFNIRHVEAGQTLTEYGVIFPFVLVIGIVLGTVVGPSSGQLYLRLMSAPNTCDVAAFSPFTYDVRGETLAQHDMEPVGYEYDETTDTIWILYHTSDTDDMNNAHYILHPTPDTIPQTNVMAGEAIEINGQLIEPLPAGDFCR